MPQPSWTAAWADSAGQLLDLYYTAKDLSADLASRLEDYESNDGELDEIEQRLDLIYKLKAKYGDTVEDVLAFGGKGPGRAGAHPVLPGAPRPSAS